MLKARLKAHREFILARAGDQKLFVALKLKPVAQAVQSRPQLTLAFVVDTSESMREKAAGNSRKIDLVVDALQKVVSTNLLLPNDQVALVCFDDRADVLVPISSLKDRSAILHALRKLLDRHGGTHMGAGLNEGLRLLRGCSGNRRIVLFTDGQAFDEEVCHQAARDLGLERIPVTALGVGHDWNEDLLTSVTDATQGIPFHIAADSDNPKPPSVRASDLPGLVLHEVSQAARDVVTNITLTAKTVPEVRVNQVTRVFPSLSQIDTSANPMSLGNAGSGDDTVFVIELTLPERPPGRVRIAQFGLGYVVPGMGQEGTLPNAELIVQYTTDESQTAVSNEEILQWVRQRNLETVIKRGVTESQTDPEKARHTLMAARNLTVSLGNHAMTAVLDGALNEIGNGKTIRPGTMKTLRVGSKTQAIKFGEDLGGLTEQQIRDLSGT